MFRRKNGRIGSSASPLLRNEFKDQSGLTEEPVKKRKEEKGGRGRRYHVVALLNSRKVQGDFQDRAYHFVFGSVGDFGKPRWVATEAEVLAAGTGFLQNICFSATHMEKHLPFVMFVCLLAFDGKHCEISFGALPVVNLCNV